MKDRDEMPGWLRDMVQPGTARTVARVLAELARILEKEARGRSSLESELQRITHTETGGLYAASVKNRAVIETFREQAAELREFADAIYSEFLDPKRCQCRR